MICLYYLETFPYFALFLIRSSKEYATLLIYYILIFFLLNGGAEKKLLSDILKVSHKTQKNPHFQNSLVNTKNQISKEKTINIVE